MKSDLTRNQLIAKVKERFHREAEEYLEERVNTICHIGFDKVEEKELKSNCYEVTAIYALLDYVDDPIFFNVIYPDGQFVVQEQTMKRILLESFDVIFYFIYPMDLYNRPYNILKLPERLNDHFFEFDLIPVTEAVILDKEIEKTS